MTMVKPPGRRGRRTRLAQRVLVGSKQRKLWKSFIRPTVHALLLNHDHDRSDQHVAGRSNRKLCWPGAASVLGGDLNKNIDLARRDNSFLYKTPSFKGLSAELFVSLGEQVKDSGKQSNSLGNSYSIALEYASHNVMLRGVYLYDKLSLKIQGEDLYQTVLFGGSYDLGEPSLR